VDEFLSLILDGFDNLWVAVTGRGDRNPSRKIQVSIAIHIPNMDPSAVVHYEWVVAWIRRRNNLLIAIDNRLGLGTRQLRLHVVLLYFVEFILQAIEIITLEKGYNQRL
jgi:hypothetical protein